jgi:protein phosphatase
MIRISGDTHAGRVREHNEDAVFIDSERGLALVADGMGGHASGEVASRLVAETFAESASSVDPHSPRLSELLLDAHQRIVANAASEPIHNGMGSTAVAVVADGDRFRVSWVGDSRLYRWRRGSGLQQLSRDHSYLDWLISQGKVSSEEARVHPQRNVVTQCLGLADPQPDELTDHWRHGDRLLLCSDGLTDELDDEAIALILSQHGDLDAARSALIDAALSSGGRDNISVVLLENGAEQSVEWRELLRSRLVRAGLLALGLLALGLLFILLSRS